MNWNWFHRILRLYYVVHWIEGHHFMRSLPKASRISFWSSTGHNEFQKSVQIGSLGCTDHTAYECGIAHIIQHSTDHTAWNYGIPQIIRHPISEKCENLTAFYSSEMQIIIFTWWFECEDICRWLWSYDDHCKMKLQCTYQNNGNQNSGTLVRIKRIGHIT